MTVPADMTHRAGSPARRPRQSFAEQIRSRRRMTARLTVVRLLIVTNLILGFHYLAWRYTGSINWRYWPLALLLLAAETYSFFDSFLFGVTVWKWRRRGAPPPPRGDETVDVLITCYNEPVEVVRATVRAAMAIRHPHRTFVLDDGASPAMRRMAAEEGAGYIVRSPEWRGRARHAKAGNLNNALFQTGGEFILIQDADQIPAPDILDRTLGYFRDPTVAFVQTPQWFRNVPAGDPFGSQSELFYGPLQEGKDGWNAAFFCGSNAVLRREALFQAGFINFARDQDLHLRRALNHAMSHLRRSERAMSAVFAPERRTLGELRDATHQAQRAQAAGAAPTTVMTVFARQVYAVVERALAAPLPVDAAVTRPLGIDRAAFRADLAALTAGPEALRALAERRFSPLAPVAAVRTLLLSPHPADPADVMPVMPIATTSVTEDMATAMRIHALGWNSVYHPEVLATGLAPEDLQAALRQRSRWAQGTLQALFGENPLRMPGLRPGQRLTYLATMWSYLAGFATVIYLAAPVLYLMLGWTPVDAWSSAFFWRFIPYLLVNQALFFAVSWGLKTWRGQQYTVALFPVWIAACLGAARSVFRGRDLSFQVTPKTRQEGPSLQLIWPQLVALALLAGALAVGLARLALGLVDDTVPVLVNVLWASYDIAILSVLLASLGQRRAPAVAARRADIASVRPAEGIGAGHREA